MQNYLKQLFMDVDGEPSMKRHVEFLAFLAAVVFAAVGKGADIIWPFLALAGGAAAASVFERKS